MSIPPLDKPLFLYDNADKETVVTFQKGLKGPATFGERYGWLADELISAGIRIPEAAVSAYNDKRIIVLTDSEFGKAFFQFYVTENFASSRYLWKDIESKV